MRFWSFSPHAMFCCWHVAGKQAHSDPSTPPHDRSLCVCVWSQWISWQIFFMCGVSGTILSLSSYCVCCISGAGHAVSMCFLLGYLWQAGQLPQSWDVQLNKDIILHQQTLHTFPSACVAACHPHGVELNQAENAPVLEESSNTWPAVAAISHKNLNAYKSFAWMEHFLWLLQCIIELFCHSGYRMMLRRLTKQQCRWLSFLDKGLMVCWRSVSLKSIDPLNFDSI